MHRIIKRVIITILILFAFSKSYAVEAENTALVVNSESEDSKKIAQTYIKLRDIPAQNVIELSGIKNVESCSVEEFRQTILIPVLNTIKARELETKIDLVAYSAGIPWYIEIQDDMKSDNLWSPYKKPFASITGLTFLYEMVLKKDFYNYTDSYANWYVRLPVVEIPDSEWSAADIADKKKIDRFFKQKVIYEKESLSEFRKKLKKEGKKFTWKMKVTMREKDRQWENEQWPKVRSLLAELKKKHPFNPDISIKYAQSLTLEGQHEKAVKSINDARKGGLFEYISVTSETDFAPLKKLDSFKAVISKMKESDFTIPSPLEFSSNNFHKKDGSAGTEKTGRRYLLSMVLGVTSGRGNTADEVIKMLERSRKAEGTNPDGTIYIAKNGGVRSTTREWAFAKTIEQLKKQGIKAEIVEGKLPQKKTDIAGAVLGTAAFDWKKSESIILPGAVCEHLTSFGGRLFKSAGQTPISEHIRHGASGSSGTVAEPYAIQAKFPMPYFHCYYTSGYTMAECFFMTIKQPFQILLIGDPLCRPWKKK
ncbi:MAG: hypothetical protein ACYTFY_20570 [Planctomycetota bacterium]|jgi:uncharacterized protein (TIGR03790 family)